MSSRPSTRRVRSVRSRPRSFGRSSLRDERRGRVADGGDQGPGADQLAVGGHDRGAGRLADAGPEPDLDAALLEEAAGVLAEGGRQLAEQAVGKLDDEDADLAPADVGVEDERPLDQLHHLAGGLDAREAAADDGEGQELLLDLRQGGDVGVLELVDDGVAQGQRVAQRLHGQRMRGEAGDAREVDALAEREHEVVVADLGVAPLQSLEDGDDLPLEVDGVDLRLAHPDARQEAPERRHGVAHRDAARRHLGQQRLEGEVVHLVDQLDVGDAARRAAAVPGPRTCRRSRRRARGFASCRDRHQTSFSGARTAPRVNQ